MRKYSVWVLVLLGGCDLQALGPGDACWWQYTASAMVTDTVWNETGNPDMPFLLVGRRQYTDSARVCR